MYSGEITKPAVEYIIKTLLGRLYSQLEKTELVESLFSRLRTGSRNMRALLFYLKNGTNA